MIKVVDPSDIRYVVLSPIPLVVRVDFISRLMYSREYRDCLCCSFATLSGCDYCDI